MVEEKLQSHSVSGLSLPLSEMGPARQGIDTRQVPALGLIVSDPGGPGLVLTRS